MCWWTLHCRCRRQCWLRASHSLFCKLADKALIGCWSLFSVTETSKQASSCDCWSGRSGAVLKRNRWTERNWQTTASSTVAAVSTRHKLPLTLLNSFCLSLSVRPPVWQCLLGDDAILYGTIQICDWTPVAKSDLCLYITCTHTQKRPISLEFEIGILKFYFRFHRDIFIVIGVWFCVGVPNFIQIGPSI